MSITRMQTCLTNYRLKEICARLHRLHVYRRTCRQYTYVSISSSVTLLLYSFFKCCGPINQSINHSLIFRLAK